MFGMGLTLGLVDFIRVFKEPQAALIGISMQMLAIPLVALLIALTFKLSPQLAVGLMIISFVPGGTTSNIFTSLAKGDVALSISLTAVVSLITPFTIPLVLILAMRYFLGQESVVDIPLVKTIFQLLIITVLPVSLGMFIFSKWEKIANKIDPIIRLFSIVFLFFIVLAIVIKYKNEMIGFFIQAGAATLTLNILVLGLGYFLGKYLGLSQKQTISLSYEVGMQNAPLAMIIAGTIIGSEIMMIPALTYGLLMFITGFLFKLVLDFLS